MSIPGGIDNKNSVALMQDDTTCTEMITEARAEADLGFTLRDYFTRYFRLDTRLSLFLLSTGQLTTNLTTET